MTRPKAAVGAAVAGMTLCAGLAVAQSSAQAAGGASASGHELEQIVVTAEKRRSTVQSTPISITALSGADLTAAGLSSMVAVAQQVPGLSFKTSGPGQTEFEMRGLTSTGGESPTVGFYLDETALTPPAMAQNGKVVIDPDLYDLNRIEVLRGPQGTLYGAGSMGGTVKLVTNEPDPRSFAASAQAIGSGTDGGGFNHTFNAMLNAPLWNNSALRVVVTDKHIAGWIDRDVLNPFPLETNNSTLRGDVAAAPVAQRIKQSNWEILKGGRATLLVQPTDRLRVSAGVMYQRINQGAPNTIDVPPGNEVHYQPFDVSEPFQDVFNLYHLNVKYEFDGFQVVSATSNWTRRQLQTQDISEAMQYYIGGFLGPPANFPFSTAAGGLGAGSISEDDYSRQVSEELRVASTGDGAWQWLMGGYYSNFRATSHVYSYYDGFTALFGTNNLADNHRALGVDQYALFGETSYLLPDHLKATVGARYFTYHSNSATSVSGISANGTSATLHGLAANSGVTPKVNLAYIPNDDLTVYATIAKGFRPGGPNSPIPPPCTPAPTQFGPDSVWSYELGEKARLFDSRVSLNGDVYYELWNDVQQQVAPGCGYKFTTNAGKAKAYGAEVELALNLAEGWLLSQNLGYTHATNSTTVTAAGVVSGDRLLDVPEITANTSIAYRRPFGHALAFVARATNSYVGSIQDITYTRNTLPSYDLVAARAGVEADRWSATLFIDNLTNKRALLSNTGALSANISILNRVATNQPRTIGADLSVKF
ncbi:MAG: TonB-dependent receptor [Gammaproteobacteria bacterium]|nr:TonB-dependent receptor [Gammaproteobacteria bacterium]